MEKYFWGNGFYPKARSYLAKENLDNASVVARLRDDPVFTTTASALAAQI